MNFTCNTCYFIPNRFELTGNVFYIKKKILHQGLCDNDFANKVSFRIHRNSMIDKYNNTLKKILFSEETEFKINGSINRHNIHY